MTRKRWTAKRVARLRIAAAYIREQREQRLDSISLVEETARSNGFELSEQTKNALVTGSLLSARYEWLIYEAAWPTQQANRLEKLAVRITTSPRLAASYWLLLLIVGLPVALSVHHPNLALAIVVTPSLAIILFVRRYVWAASAFIFHKQRMAKTDPRLAAFMVLQGSLCLIQQTSSFRFSLPPVRRHHTRNISFAARIYEKKFPRRFAIPDRRANREFEHRCKKAANAMRGWIVELSLPGIDSQRELAAKLAMQLAVLSSGRFAYLPGAELKDEFDRHPIVTRLVIAIRQLVIGIVPFVLIIWVQPKYGPRMTTDIRQWITVGAIIWLFLTLIAPLDPLFASKLTAIKDVISSVRGGEKPK